MAIAPKLQSYLTQTNTQYKVIEHPKTFSSQAIAETTHVPADHIAKGVVLKDDSGYLLATIPASQWLDVARLDNELNRVLQLATEAEVAALLDDCHPGAIPPFGQVYGLETVVDQGLLTLAKVCFEAGDHQALLCIPGAEFKALVQGARHGYFCEQN